MLSWWVDAERDGAVARGDFPAFYAAAKIIHSGRPDMLYDPLLQRRIENESWPSLEGRYLAFAYPPYVAQLLSPLGALSASSAKFVFTTIMFGFLVLAWQLSRSWLSVARPRPWLMLGLLACFPPLTAGVLGGQNISLSLCIAAAVLALLWEESGQGAQRRFAVGVLIGCWLFKPHFACLAAMPLLVVLGVPFLFGFLSVALTLYSWSASQFGLGWPLAWLEQAAQFSLADGVANQHQMVSLAPVLRSLLYLGVAHEEGWTGPVLEGAVVVFGMMALCGWLIRARTEAGGYDDGTLRKLLLLLPPAVVLLSPHSMFYESALCLLTLAQLWRVTNDAGVVAVIGLYLFSFVCVTFRDLLPFQPLVVIPFAALLLVAGQPSTSFGALRSRPKS